MTNESLDPPSILWKRAVIISTAYQLTISVVLVLSIIVHRGGFEWSYIEAILTNWDARHYLNIASHGYQSYGADAPLICFYPLFPLIVSLIARLTGHVLIAGILVGAISSIVAHALFLRFVIGFLGYSRGARTCALFFLSPISVVFTIPYSESLYAMTLMCVMVALESRRYPFALLSAFGCSLSRMVGVLSLLPVFFSVLTTAAPRRLLVLGFLGTTVASVTAYPFLNWFLFGDPLKFLEFQRDHWHKSASNPLSNWWAHLNELINGIVPESPWMFLDNFLTVLFPLIVLSYVVISRNDTRKLSFPWILWLLAQWAIIASQSFLLASTRYILICLPLYIVFERIAPRQPVVFGTILGLLLMVTAFAFQQAGTGGWLY